MTNQKYLFRGKPVNSTERGKAGVQVGDFVFGYYSSRQRFERVRHYIQLVSKGEAVFIQVDPKTVGQVYATGLPRLPKIAIGDLVKVQGTKRNGVYMTEIVHSRNGGYTLEENKTYLNDDFIIPAVLEIVGSKFDNPELLTTTPQ